MKGKNNLGTENKQGNGGNEGVEYIGEVSHQKVKRSTTQHPLARISRIPILYGTTSSTPNKFKDAGKAVSVDSKRNANGITKSSTTLGKPLLGPDSN